jgi:uncharacterized membrane protein
MNYLPKSIIGWIFIIFASSGLILNIPENEGLIDYLLRIAFVYVLFFIFSNLFSSSSNKNISKKQVLKNSTKKESKVLEEQLKELEEIEKVRKLKDEINEKRKSLNLNSLDHFDTILKKINKYRKNLNKQKNLYEDLLRLKKNNLTVLVFFLIIYGLVIFYQISIRDLLGLTTILLTIAFFTLAGLLLYRRFKNLSTKSEEVYEKILEIELSLKDLELEKKKNEPTNLK